MIDFFSSVNSIQIIFEANLYNYINNLFTVAILSYTELYCSDRPDFRASKYQRSGGALHNDKGVNSLKRHNNS